MTQIEIGAREIDEKSLGDRGAPAENATSTGDSLRVKAIRGSIWTIAGYGTSQILRLGSNLILTRLLFPEAFGLMALVNVFMQGLAMFSDVGIGPSIIQNKRGEDPVFLNTAWTIQVIRGVVLWFISCLIAWPMANLYDQPLLGHLLPIAGLSALIAGFNSTSFFTCNRNLALGRLTLLDLTTQVISIGVMCTWAWFSPSVWALVGGVLTGALLKMILSHVFLPGVVARFRWDREASKALFHFGRWIFVSTFLTFFAFQADRLIFGKMIPLSALGVFSIAATFANLPRQVILRLGSSVVFPAYSAVNQNQGSLGNVFYKARIPLILAGGFIITILISSGTSVIKLLYDERYWDGAIILPLLAIGCWFQILVGTNSSALLALGKPYLLAAGNLAKVLGMILLIPLGFYLYGFIGAVTGSIVAETLVYSVSATAIGLNRLPCWKMDLATTILVVVGVALSSAVNAFSGFDSYFVIIAVSVAISSVIWGGIAWIKYRKLVP